MLLKLRKYSFSIDNTPVKNLLVTDTLSHACCQKDYDRDLLEDIDVMVRTVVEQFSATPEIILGSFLFKS